MTHSVNDDAALEEVMGFLQSPPAAGSPDDARFGERLKQVLAASIPDDDEDGEPGQARLAVPEDLRLRLANAAQDRSRKHPFGENPDGLGPTLGGPLGDH